jgi:curved DNA-binding protein CbpA
MDGVLQCSSEDSLMAEFENHYKVLQVDPSAEPEIIAAAYRRLALKYHPDTNKSPEATRKMQEINNAYSVLSDSDARAQYDQERANQRQVKPAKAHQDPGEQQQREQAEAKQNSEQDRHRQAEAEAARWREQERQRRDKAEAEQNSEQDRRRQAEAEAARWREQERQRRDKAEVERNWAAYESWKRDGQMKRADPGISELGRGLAALFVGGAIPVILVLVLIFWGTIRVWVIVIVALALFWFVRTAMHRRE